VYNLLQLKCRAVCRRFDFSVCFAAFAARRPSTYRSILPASPPARQPGSTTAAGERSRDVTLCKRALRERDRGGGGGGGVRNVAARHGRGRRQDWPSARCRGRPKSRVHSHTTRLKKKRYPAHPRAKAVPTTPRRAARRFSCALTSPWKAWNSSPTRFSATRTAA